MTSCARLFNDLEPDAVRCPYGVYDELRSRSPEWVPELEAYVVTRFADVQQVLNDAATFSSQTVKGPVPMREMMQVLEGLAAEDPEFAAMLANDIMMRPVLLAADGDEHRRRRALVNKAFTPRRIKTMEADIDALAHRLIDAFVDRGEVELVSAFAAPLPLAIIARSIGVPDDNLATFKRWSADLFAPLGTNSPSKEVMTSFLRSQKEFVAYMSERIAERQESSAQDVLSDLVRAEEDGQRLSRTETLVICFELLAAGNETTTNLITQTMLMLVERPELMAAVRADLGLLPALIEESLRLEGPIQSFYRTATVDTTIGGVAMPAGTHVLVVFGAANRDERHFPDADAVDFGRDNARTHVAFGRGAHACPGSLLARTEARISLEALLTRLDDIRLATSAEELVYVPSYVARGVLGLPLSFTPAGRAATAAEPLTAV
jgi:cytochrome P450